MEDCESPGWDAFAVLCQVYFQVLTFRKTLC